jgi:hypothetical protein
MALITTADQRMAQRAGIKMVIAGPSGIGKTSLVWTLDPASTLVVDMEAGMLALEGWQGDSLDVRSISREMGLHPWEFLRALACLIAGPSPSVTDPNKPYSQAHYQWVAQHLGEREAVLGKYQTLFFDSITQSARYAFSWSQTQPEAFNQAGKYDGRGAYGKMGQEMVGGGGWLSHLQHTADKNIVLVGILQNKKDEYGRASWELQVDGGKTSLELPGIVDEVISMVEMKADDGTPYRAFVCQTLNQWGYPAKDRSGRLDLIEEPHLGKLMAKMRAGSRPTEMVTTMPEASGTATQGVV